MDKRSVPRLGTILGLFITGIAGSVVMIAILGLGSLIGGYGVTLPLILGQWITGRSGAPAWFAGSIGFCISGGVIALIYATIFWTLGRPFGDPDWKRGALLGYLHGLLQAYVYQWVVLFPGYLPANIPIPPSFYEDPRIFGFGTGPVTAIAMLVAFTAYGAVVGARTPPRRRAGTQESSEREPSPSDRMAA